MRELLLAAATVMALAAGAASAADLPVAYNPPPPVRPACAQFGGFFVGANAGWNYYRHDWKDLDNYGVNGAGIFHAGDGTNYANGWHGGIQAGYTWQSGCTVYSVLADWAWTRTTAEDLYQGFPGAGAGALAASSQLKSFGTARTRTGIVVDNTLLYVTGGFAFANASRNLAYTVTGGGASQVFSETRWRSGFVVGAGTEWAINNSWSFGSEFLYIGLQKDDQAFACSVAATCGALPAGTTFRYQFNDSIWVTRFTLNYRFGGWAPYAAF